VFAQDVLQCPCGGRRTVVAFVADAHLTRSLLTSLGLPAEPATFAPLDEVFGRPRLDREARVSFEHLLRELRPLAWAP